jgi:DnaA family protein
VLVTPTATNCTANGKSHSPRRPQGLGPHAGSARAGRAMRQLVLELAPPAAATLNNFVVGRNAELVHSLRGVAERGATSIFVWGEPGSGRTHLMQGVISAVRERSGTAEYLACTRGARLHEALHRLDGVAIDDVERLAPEEQVDLFSLYNALRDRGAAFVVSGSAPLHQLGLRHDVATRLASGLVYQVHALSDEEKIRALQNHAAARGIRLPEEVPAYLLGRVRRDMGTLLAVLDAVDRSSLAVKRAITVPFVRDWLQAKGQDSGSGIQD